MCPFRHRVNPNQLTLNVPRGDPGLRRVIFATPAERALDLASKLLEASGGARGPARAAARAQHCSRAPAAARTPWRTNVTRTCRRRAPTGTRRSQTRPRPPARVRHARATGCGDARSPARAVSTCALCAAADLYTMQQSASGMVTITPAGHKAKFSKGACRARRHARDLHRARAVPPVDVEVTWPYPGAHHVEVYTSYDDFQASTRARAARARHGVTGPPCADRQRAQPAD